MYIVSGLNHFDNKKIADLKESTQAKYYSFELE